MVISSFYHSNLINISLIVSSFHHSNLIDISSIISRASKLDISTGRTAGRALSGLKMGFQSRATRLHKSPCRSVGRTVGLCSRVIFWQFWRPIVWDKLNQILTIHELLPIPTVSSVSHGFCPHQTRSCRRHQNRVRDGRHAKYSFARYSSFRKFPSYPLNLK